MRSNHATANKRNVLESIHARVESRVAKVDQALLLDTTICRSGGDCRMPQFATPSVPARRPGSEYTHLREPRAEAPVRERLLQRIELDVRGGHEQQRQEQAE
ncbi:MAG TPA: hypothetical protein VM846_08925 [Vicinamibacterales bacterium]|nr:hypothetical protein [Vicinamibacterales bacterium]